MAKWTRSIGKIGKLSGYGTLKRKTYMQPVTGIRLPQPTDLPEDLEAAKSTIGHSAAGEVNVLRQKGFQGTIPELMTMSWLNRRKVNYQWQLQVPQAGAILDFEIAGTPMIALRIMGEYWHRPARGQYDKEQRFMLELMGYEVVDVWERQIYKQRERVLSEALKGREVLR